MIIYLKEYYVEFIIQYHMTLLKETNPQNIMLISEYYSYSKKILYIFAIALCYYSHPIPDDKKAEESHHTFLLPPPHFLPPLPL